MNDDSDMTAEETTTRAREIAECIVFDPTSSESSTSIVRAEFPAGAYSVNMTRAIVSALDEIRGV